MFVLCVCGHIGGLVTEKQCEAPPEQTNGEKFVCDPPYKYLGTCSYGCLEGYELPGARTDMQIACRMALDAGGTPTTNVEWDAQPTPCNG